MKLLVKKRLLNHIVIFSCVIMIGIGLQMGQKVKPNLNLALSKFDKTTITEIQILRNQQIDMALQKIASGWQMTLPRIAMVKDPIIQQLLSLLEVKTDSYYAADSLSLSEYGLAHPTVILKFNELQIMIGDYDAVENSRYLLIEQTVFKVSNTYFAFLDEPIETYIAHPTPPN